MLRLLFFSGENSNGKIDCFTVIYMWVITLECEAVAKALQTGIEHFRTAQRRNCAVLRKCDGFWEVYR